MDGTPTVGFYSLNRPTVSFLGDSSMLLTNITDYVAKNEYEVDSAIRFHIPDHPLYEELNFPYYFREGDSALLDSKDQFAIITAELLDNTNWAIITPHGDL